MLWVIDSLVRPTAARLNSLAGVLQQALPLYTECRSILNYLDPSDGIALLLPRKDSVFSPDYVWDFEQTEGLDVVVTDDAILQAGASCDD